MKIKLNSIKYNTGNIVIYKINNTFNLYIFGH